MCKKYKVCKFFKVVLGHLGQTSALAVPAELVPMVDHRQGTN